MNSNTSSRLFGREEETQHLRELFCRVFNDNPPIQVCFIHGASGSGKTALCRQLSQPQSTTQDFYYIEGKFDDHDTCSAPYSALVRAFDSLGMQVIKRSSEAGMGQDDLDDLRTALELEAKPLVDLVPSFAVIMKRSSQEDNKTREQVNGPGMEMASRRLAIAFQGLLKQFCTPARPLVWFVDDLHWADPYSLEVLGTILTEVSTSDQVPNLMMMLGYCDEGETSMKSVSSNKCLHLVQEFVLSLSAAERVDLSEIVVNNMSDTVVNQLVASALSMDPHETDDLAKVVARKTAGNPFFVLQFLRVLLERHQNMQEQADGFQKSAPRWDAEVMKRVISHALATGSDADVAAYVNEHITHQPTGVRRLLQLAACLGFQVNRSLLQNLYDGTCILLDDTDAEGKEDDAEDGPAGSGSFDLVASMAQADDLLDVSGAAVKFANNRIHQLAYKWVQNGTHRSHVHSAIGRFLCDSYGTTTRSPYLLLAADQLNRGWSGEQGNEADRLFLMQLNLQASHVARQRSAEGLVFEFLSKASDLIRVQPNDSCDWDNSYDLVLEINNMLAEVEAARGNLVECKVFVERIFHHAKRAEDTVRAHATLARIALYQKQPRRAIDECWKALSLLGVQMLSPNAWNGWLESMRTKYRVYGLSNDVLMNLPPMTNSKMRQAMVLLTACLIYAFAAEDGLVMFMTFCKMMDLTLEYGSCEHTAIAYSAYAQILAKLGKPKESYRFSTLALRMNPSREALPTVTSFIHGMCLHLRSPLHASLEPLLEGYRIGIETGNFFHAGLNLTKYMCLYICVGLPLTNFASDVRNFISQMDLFNQRAVELLIPHLQLCTLLTGEINPRDVPSWDSLDLGHAAVGRYWGKCNDEGESDCLAENTWVAAEKFDGGPIHILSLYHHMLLACVLDDRKLLEEAMAGILSLRRRRRRFIGTHFVNYMFSLLDGLVGYSLYEATHQRKYLRVANRSLRFLKGVTTINSIPLIQLLEAQKAAVLQPYNKTMVKSLYETAIVSLLKAGFSHYGAIAYEKAGQFMIRYHKDMFWAREYLLESVMLYEEWGATVKVREMLEFHHDILNEDGLPSRHSTTILGRKRFGSLASQLRLGSKTRLALPEEPASFEVKEQECVSEEGNLKNIMGLTRRGKDSCPSLP